MIRKNKNYKFGFKHFTNYFLENELIGLKMFIQYKANLYSSIFKNMLVCLLLIYFSYNLSQSFGEILSMSFGDFLIFYFYLFFLVFSCYHFYQNDTILELINERRFNSLLYKPGNSFVNVLFYSQGGAYNYLSSKLVIIIPFLFYFKANPFQNNQILVIFLFLLICIFGFLLTQFLNILTLSLRGFSKGINYIFESIDYYFRYFPITLIGKTSFGFVFLVFPTYFIPSLIIPLNKGLEPTGFLLQVFILIILIVIFIILIYFLWKRGLEKYEAYG